VIPLKAYVLVSAIMFGLGVYGALARRHAVAVLISIELMLNAAALNFVAFSRLQGNPQAASGQVFVIFIVAVAAAEAILGLAIVLALFRALKSAALDHFTMLKW
jgi:NADH-quinone oxidoreductase subunit K